jgi:hypothetical protein
MNILMRVIATTLYALGIIAFATSIPHSSMEVVYFSFLACLCVCAIEALLEAK